jgi:hypothetical protein
MFGAPPPPATEAKMRLQSSMSVGGSAASIAPWSLLDLTTPVRSQIFLNMVGDLLCYSGVNEVNTEVDAIRCVCRELCDQINEECLTFNYDDTSCHNMGRVLSDGEEIDHLNRAMRRHPRVKFFECLLHSKSKFIVLLERLALPPGTCCSFVFEFKVTADQVRRLLQQFRVRRLSIITQDTSDVSNPAGGSEWDSLPVAQSLRTLCLRSCAEEIVRSFLVVCPQLQGLQINDSRLLSDPGVRPGCLTSLSLTWVVSMPDDQFSFIIGRCQNLLSLYISKCHVSFVSVALSRLELLSVTHCRHLTDECVTDMLQAGQNPNLRFVDLTENKGLLSPWITHTGLEIAWLMHCPHLTDQAVTHLFQHCPSLSAVNLVQSSIENALIASPGLRTLELATSQKLTDAAVTHLLQHCPSLTFVDVGHCCQLVEPRLVHDSLETILLSFCVNLSESAVVTLFAGCPSLRYVEMAVCMFDMTRFQRESGPNCQVVVNFDF